MAMLRKLSIINPDTKEKNEIDVYQITVNAPADDKDSDWVRRIEGFHEGEELITPPIFRDAVFKHSDGNYYLIPNNSAQGKIDDDFNKAHFLLQLSMGNDSANQISYINATYRRRQLETLPEGQKVVSAHPLSSEPVSDSPNQETKIVPGSKTITLEKNGGTLEDAPNRYLLGHWLTGAPAMAGAATLTAFAANKISNRLTLDEGAHHVLNMEKIEFGRVNMDFVANPLFSGLVLLPALAAVSAFAMNYAANSLVYMLENKGKLPDPDTRKLISRDSWKKAGQLGLGFMLIGGTHVALEAALGTSLQTAWNGAVNIGGKVCPAEIYGAVMLSMGLAIGFGMAFGSLIAQAVQNRGTDKKIDLYEVGQAFVAGLLGGAVASIGFGNRGLSFLATWAAICIVPAVKLYAPQERDAVKESAVNMVGTGKAVWAYASDISLEDFVPLTYNVAGMSPYDTHDDSGAGPNMGTGYGP